MDNSSKTEPFTTLSLESEQDRFTLEWLSAVGSLDNILLALCSILRKEEKIKKAVGDLSVAGMLINLLWVSSSG